MTDEHAPFDETEAGSDFERLPEGTNYVAFFSGLMPRDPETGAPMFKERDKRDYGKGGQVVTDSQGRVVKERTIHYGFTVIWPEQYGGFTTIGTAAWKGIRVVPQPDGTNRVQIDRVGTWIPHNVKWPELCGITWTPERFPVPKTGDVTDQDLLEILDKSLLERARAKRLLVLKVNKDGYLNSREDNHIMPLGQDEAQKIQGIPYEVPTHYKAATETQGLIPFERWTDESMELGREYLRTVIKDAALGGDKILTLDEANTNAWFAKAMQLGGGDHAERIKSFADLMTGQGYDGVDIKVLASLISLVTGVPVQENIVNALRAGELESAVVNMPVFVGMVRDMNIESFVDFKARFSEAPEEVTEL